MHLIVIVGVVGIVLFASPAAAAVAAANYRLPTSVVPRQYRLDIVTNLGDDGDKFEFYGEVTIQAIVENATKTITLHAKNLDIDTKRIRINENGTKVVGTQTDDENEFFTILLEEELPANSPVYIHMVFRAPLEDGLAGYYRSSYMDKASGKRRYLAVTQFESTDARRAFPCFDEPAQKAKFTISLGHAENYTALSNMEAVKREPIEGKSGWVWTRFAETVPMSTYLVAFLVSDFAYEVADMPSATDKVKFRVWTRREVLPQAQFAKVVGPKALAYFERFFGIPYPLPKQDMVAVPDFNAGAMENWGLITYRETALLVDKETSSASSRQSVASTIAHELAHQWFGNLVTMTWWTDLWLNEGFATYMAALAVDHLHPEWNYLTEESVNNLLTVFDFDSLKSSHPISVPVGHPREIAEIFDTISYRKGSYILRMMSLFLGEQTLQQGVSNYLLKHRYQNAAQDDLWASLTVEAHANNVLPLSLTVKTIMDTWTLQTGYPVLGVQRDYETGMATVTQRRFLRDNLQAKSEQAHWWVPLTYTNGDEKDFNSTTPKQFLADDGLPLKVPGPKNAKDWMLFNIDIAGLYRVNYDARNWQLLSAHLNGHRYDDIPVVNRIQLIEDAGALAWTNDLSYDVFFELVNYLSKETAYLPWKAALGGLYDLKNQLKRTSEFGALRNYMHKLIAPAYSKFGRLTEPHAEVETSPHSIQSIKLQAMIAKTACSYHVDACVKDAKGMFAKHMIYPEKNVLPKNLRSIITCNAIRNGGEKEWDFVWQQYLAADVASVKVGMLNDLGCTSEPWLLRRFLEWSIQPEGGIRTQDFSTVFRTVASNQYGFYIAKEFLTEKIKEIAALLYPNGRRLTRCISSLTSQMITQSELDWFEKLTVDHADAFKDSQQGVQQSRETIKLNIQWQRAHDKNIRTFFDRHLIHPSA